MIQHKGSGEVRMIPIDQIEVLNTRERNQKVFDEITENVKAVGLKKPITVVSRPQADGTEKFLLVCGEGRLKIFKRCGETHIPALVGEGTDEDAFIKSLVENVAKTKRRPLEILSDIQRLRDRGGYSPKEIADKTGLNISYVHGVLTLLQNGEERLLVAVEKGRVPLTAAMTIAAAGDDDRAVQGALQEAYESGKLRGSKLDQARKIIEHRKTFGRTIASKATKGKPSVSTSSLVRTYQKEVARQKLMVKKAEYAQQRLLFVIGALRSLYTDEDFGNLLRSEGLDTLPKYLADRIWSEGGQP